MFNFYVVLPGCDTAGLPRAGENSKPHHYKKGTKIEGPSENSVSTGKQFEDFRRKKKNRNIILELSKKPCGTPGP